MSEEYSNRPQYKRGDLLQGLSQTIWGIITDTRDKQIFGKLGQQYYVVWYHDGKYYCEDWYYSDILRRYHRHPVEQ